MYTYNIHYVIRDTSIQRHCLESVSDGTYVTVSVNQQSLLSPSDFLCHRTPGKRLAGMGWRGFLHNRHSCNAGRKIGKYFRRGTFPVDIILCYFRTRKRQTDDKLRRSTLRSKTRILRTQLFKYIGLEM